MAYVMTADELPAPVAGLKPVVGTAPNSVRRMVGRVVFVLAVMATVGLATLWITNGLGSDSASPSEAVNGLSIFAVFFAAALAVERLLEPLTLLDPKKPALEKDTKEKKAEVVAAANATAAQDKLLDAADAAAKAEMWATYRAIFFWALASIVGALAAALLNLHLLRATGIQTNLYLEILATGLIIGAGTKPLHELNKLVTAKKA